MRALAAVAAFAIAALPGFAHAGLEDELPLNQDRGVVLCNVAGILVHDGLLVIRCAEPSKEGLVFFTVERDTKRYEDVKDFATWAQEKGRPLAILYSNLLRHNPGDCDPKNCRAVLGVERR